MTIVEVKPEACSLYLRRVSAPPEQSRLQDEPLSFTHFTQLLAYQSVLSAHPGLVDFISWTLQGLIHLRGRASPLCVVFSSLGTSHQTVAGFSLGLFSL